VTSATVRSPPSAFRTAARISCLRCTLLACASEADAALACASVVDPALGVGTVAWLLADESSGEQALRSTVATTAMRPSKCWPPLFRARKGRGTFANGKAHRPRSAYIKLFITQSADPARHSQAEESGLGPRPDGVPKAAFWASAAQAVSRMRSPSFAVLSSASRHLRASVIPTAADP
jgi:hypothetical protein